VVFTCGRVQLAIINANSNIRWKMSFALILSCHFPPQLTRFSWAEHGWDQPIGYQIYDKLSHCLGV